MTVFNQTIFIAAPNGQVQKVEYRHFFMTDFERSIFLENKKKFQENLKKRKATA